MYSNKNAYIHNLTHMLHIMYNCVAMRLPMHFVSFLAIIDKNYEIGLAAYNLINVHFLNSGSK